jgi:hypothetical protein
VTGHEWSRVGFGSPEFGFDDESSLRSFDDLSHDLPVRELDPKHFDSFGDCGVFGQIKHLGSLELVERI